MSDFFERHRWCQYVIAYVIMLIIILIMQGVLYVCYAQTKPRFAVAKHLTYTVVYDYQHMSPFCVFYNLDAADFRGSQKYRPRYFKMDNLLPPPHRHNDSFKFSGYERGHLCPAGDRDSRSDWMKDTYYTSNVVPMTHEVNSYVWKSIEDSCRALAVGGHPLAIISGPVFTPSGSNTIHESTLAIPDSLWRIAVCRTHPDEWWYWCITNSHGSDLCRPAKSDTDSITLRQVLVKRNLIDLWIRK